MLSASHFGQTRRHIVVVMTAEHTFRAKADADASTMLFDARFGISRHSNAVSLTAECASSARGTAYASPMLRASRFSTSRYHNAVFLNAEHATSAKVTADASAARADHRFFLQERRFTPTVESRTKRWCQLPASALPFIPFRDSNPLSRMHACRPGRSAQLDRSAMLNTMKRIRLLLSLFLAAMQFVRGGENSLETVYQPLDPMVDGDVVVREVPFVTSGPYPEVFLSAITFPHIPQQSTQHKAGDINVASRAGLSLRCESASAGQRKFYIIWDFSKADPKLVNDALIDALLMCLEKTAGKATGLYSKFIGQDRFPGLKDRIIAKIPEQTEQQRKADSRGK